MYKEAKRTKHDAVLWACDRLDGSRRLSATCWDEIRSGRRAQVPEARLCLGETWLSRGGPRLCLFVILRQEGVAVHRRARPALPRLWGQHVRVSYTACTRRVHSSAVPTRWSAIDYLRYSCWKYSAPPANGCCGCAGCKYPAHRLRNRMTMTLSCDQA
jgi:hypothetical protein